MATIEAKGLEKDHSRWQSEHGHWLKDLTIWHQRHKAAQDIVDALECSLKEFSDQVEAQRSHIEQHNEVVKMHDNAMSWRREHPEKKKGATAGSSDPIHEFQTEIHQHEKDIHQQLAKMHEKIRTDAARLVDALGLTF
jgi:hypothetical protein